MTYSPQCSSMQTGLVAALPSSSWKAQDRMAAAASNEIFFLCNRLYKTSRNMTCFMFFELIKNN